MRECPISFESGSVMDANAGGKHDAQEMPISTCNVKWVEPGTWARKVSTCSRLDVRLGMDCVPIGVMREKGVPTLLVACMMIAEQCKPSWASLEQWACSLGQEEVWRRERQL